MIRLFEMRSVLNTYDCIACKAAGREHEVAYVEHGVTGVGHRYGQGIPTTMRRCLTCGAQDGPWIDNPYVKQEIAHDKS